MLRQNSLGREKGAARSWHAVISLIGPGIALLELRLLQNSISGMNKGRSEALLDMTGFVVVPDFNLKHELEHFFYLPLLLLFNPQTIQILRLSCSEVTAQRNRN